MWSKRSFILFTCLVLVASSVGAWDFLGSKSNKALPTTESLLKANEDLQKALNAKDDDLRAALQLLSEAKQTLESLQSNLAVSKSDLEAALAENQELKTLLAAQKQAIAAKTTSFDLMLGGGVAYDFATIKPMFEVGAKLNNLSLSFGAELAPDWDDLVRIDNLIPKSYSVKAGFWF